MDAASSPLQHRFQALLGHSSTAAYDAILLERPEWVAAPTLGAITPGWLLIIPKQWALSFRDWSLEKSLDPGVLVRELQAHLGLAEDECLWFEHGPTEKGSSVGCGLDHAHIHVLVRPSFTFADFEDLARKSSDLTWSRYRADGAYKQLNTESSYLIAGLGDQAIVASDVDSVGSQFFRRMIADLVSARNEWDYRKHAHIENVVETANIFRRLQKAA